MMLDDVHLLAGTPTVDVLAMVIDYLPPGVTLAAAGRTDGGLPLARLRASGRLVEIGIADLALDEQEAARLAALGGRELPPARGPRPPCQDRGLAGRGLPGGAPRARPSGGQRLATHRACPAGTPTSATTSTPSSSITRPRGCGRSS